MSAVWSPSRRVLLRAAALSALSSVVACSENQVTGRTQLTLVSDEMLAEMSRAAWADVLASMPASSDAAAQRRLERIGRGIAEASSQPDLNWEFVLFDSPDINAFVLPGGKVGFFQGLFDFARSDGEIAAVIGHEIGHVEARHAAERFSQQALVQIGVSIASAALSEEYGEHAQTIAAALGMGVMYGVVLPYSRAHELEADRLGIGLMQRASYEPTDALQFWRRMVEANAQRPDALEWLSTHPADDRRMEVMSQELALLATQH